MLLTIGVHRGGVGIRPPPLTPQNQPPPLAIELMYCAPPPDQIFDNPENIFAAFGGERENLHNFYQKTTLFQALLCKNCVKST